jgi:hypothetical protein
MNALLQQVMGSIDSSVVREVAGRLGIPPDQAQNAIGAAVPAILGAIEQHASTPEGADAVHAAAQQHAGMDVSQILGAMGGAGGMQNVLGQIFGANHDAAAQSVGNATGLPQAHASQIMSVLGPLVLSAIGNHAQLSGQGSQGLGPVLGDASQQMQGGGLLGKISSLFGQH